MAAGSFYRTAEAQAAGLNGGMAFAVYAGDDLIGVIEVFSVRSASAIPRSTS